MNKQKHDLLQFAKKTFNEGHKITLIYDKMMPTGEIACTFPNFKSFKEDLNRAIKAGVNFKVRVEITKYKAFENIEAIIDELDKQGKEIVGEDNLWSYYAEQLRTALKELKIVM